MNNHASFQLKFYCFFTIFDNYNNIIGIVQQKYEENAYKKYVEHGTHTKHVQQNEHKQIRKTTHPPARRIDYQYIKKYEYKIQSFDIFIFDQLEKITRKVPIRNSVPQGINPDPLYRKASTNLILLIRYYKSFHTILMLDPRRIYLKMLRIEQQSLQSDTIIRVFKQLKKYLTKIININLKLAEKQLNQYVEQFADICQQYQNKIKQAQKATKQRIRNEILNGQCQFGRMFQELKQRSLFNTKIMNQMENNNINLMDWIKESQTMELYIIGLQGISSSGIKSSRLDKDEKIQKYRNKKNQVQIMYPNQSPTRPIKTKQKTQNYTSGLQNFQEEFQPLSLITRPKQKKTVDVKKQKSRHQNQQINIHSR